MLLELATLPTRYANVFPSHDEDNRDSRTVGVTNVEYHTSVYAQDHTTMSQGRLVRKSQQQGTVTSLPYTTEAFATLLSNDALAARRRRGRLGDDAQVAAHRGIWTESDKRIDKVMMIGPHFQCRVPHRVVGGSTTTATFAGGDCLWDPRKAALAESQGEPMEAFMNVGESLELKTMRMEALHLADYNVADAAERLSVMITSAKDPDIKLTKDEHALFLKLIVSCKDAPSTKNLCQIAKVIGRPLRTVLVHYYGWKRSNRTSYRLVKEQCRALEAKRNEEPDECSVCHDGGNLILCDTCNKAYHWKTCLPVPLAKAPASDSNWHCHRCLQGTPAILRRASSRLDASPRPSPRAPGSPAARASSASRASGCRRGRGPA